MEEDDEDTILLNSLGVTSVNSEAIEHKIFSQVKNDYRSESGESCKEYDIEAEYGVTDPSSTGCAKLYNKLQAVEVEINGIADSIMEVKNGKINDNDITDDEKNEPEVIHATFNGLSLWQADPKDRLRALQRTKAKLQKKISYFEGHASSSMVYNEFLNKSGKQKLKLKHKKKQKVAQQSFKDSKWHSKSVAYDEDAEFDAALDSASTGFFEREREELVPKGILSHFHKIEGFKQSILAPGQLSHVEIHGEGTSGNLASCSIAKAAQSMADIARSRPSTKLLDAGALPAPDPTTCPFHRLQKRHRASLSREEKKKKKCNLKMRKRPLPAKKWRKDNLLKDEILDGNDVDSLISGYYEENQNDWQRIYDAEQSFEAMAGGLKIPNSIYTKLFDYQKVGVQWLWELHKQRAGGIIGDEMGLGKTIQVISFLGALHFSKMYKPSIIVCPVTLLWQWRREAHKWYPDFNVEILHESAHGRPLARSSDSEDDSAASFDSDNERPRSLKFKKMWDDMIDRVVRSESGLLLTTYEQLRIHGEKLLDKEWGYAVLDEGHRIRNPNAELTLVCKQLQTVHRIIMTGAPIQNKLSELWSLFDFVFPGKLGVLPVFETELAVPITVGGYANATPLQVSTAYRCAVVLRDLIMPYILRRMKADVHAQLPKKTEHVLFCSLTKEQRSVYRAFLASSEVEQIFDGRRNSLYGIDVMRKICNHPDLLERDYSNQHPDFGNPERSGKMKVVEQVLKLWKEQGHRVLFFTQTQQFLNIIESFLIRMEYSYRRMDGLTPVKQRMALIDEFNNSSEVFIFILTTRVGGLGTNLTGANRVIIYDPDWNPSTDMQARERAWRIGQKQDVTVYRLITRGTIEEKVYHRQIYKHFLTNKILKNPQQKRFFKAKDMKDLFTLQEDVEENGTETSSIFGSLSGDLNLGISNQNVPASPLAKERSSLGHEKEGCTNHKNNSADEERNILKCLFDAQGIHSAMNHDAIMNAHDDDKARMEEQSTRVAQRAAEALRESRMLRIRESFALPTWTGRSGAAGDPSKTHRKFGSAVNTQLLGSSRQMEGPSSSQSAAGASSGKAVSSAELLAKFRAKQERAVCDALEQDLDLAFSSSRQNTIAPDVKVASKLPSRLTVIQPEVMIRQLCTFMQQKGGQTDSASITQHFKDRILPKDLRLFKSLLKEIATLEKDAKAVRWVLKPDYQLQ